MESNADRLRMAQNGGNSDAVMINPRGDVLYPLRCRGSFHAANFCYSCGKELNEKADEPNLENYPKKTLESGKQRNVVRSFA